MAIEVLLGLFAVATVVLGYLVWRAMVTLSAERETRDLEVEAARAEGRADSRQRAKSVNLGQAIEQFVPWMTDYPFNPRDSRFLGNPIDYIVFAGLRESDRVEEVVFCEVKSGKSQLTQRERSLRDAIEEGRVRHLVVRVPTAREAERMREQAAEAA